MTAPGVATPNRQYANPDPASDWTDHAACRGADVELFFPPVGRGAAVAYETARAGYCDVCPVRLPCLRRGLAGEAMAGQRQGKHGMFGGLTPAQRGNRALVAEVLAELEQRAVSRA